MKKYLIINPYGIGDVLFTTPVARAIKEDSCDVFIGYWCNERVQDILEDNKYIDKIFALSKGDIRKIYRESKLEGIAKSVSLFNNIKKVKFDICLDFSLDYRYGLISKISGIKKRIGYNYKKRGRFLTDRINIEGYSEKHIVEYYLDLLKIIDIIPKSRNLDLFISDLEKNKSKKILYNYGTSEKDLVIGIAPGAGASWGKEAGLKHWPAIKFAQLADKIIDNLGAKIVILGDEAERPIQQALADAMKNKAIDLAGETSLKEFAALISNLKILITNDGGPLHMAAALGIKTVSIFGPVDEKVYGPYPPSANHVIIKKDMPCRPCYKRFRMALCDRDRECIKTIGTDEVYDAVRRLL